MKPALKIYDSVTQVQLDDRDCIVVTGSHGGRSVAEYAGRVVARLYAFNDAGVGKEGAGIAALALLEQRHIAVVAVSHHTARIGDAEDAWQSGVVSHVNDAAAALGFVVGQSLRSQVERLFGKI